MAAPIVHRYDDITLVVNTYTPQTYDDITLVVNATEEPPFVAYFGTTLLSAAYLGSTKLATIR